MRYFLFILAILGAIVLKSSYIFSILGFQPDFLLFLLLFVALLEGPMVGLKTGFLIGLLEDLLIGRYFGIHILTRMLVGYLIGLAEPKIFKENYLVPVVILFVGTFIYESLFIILGKLAGLGPIPEKYMWWELTKASLFQGILAPFIYVPFYKIYIRTANKEN